MRRPLRPYVDRGVPGQIRKPGGILLRVAEPPSARRAILTLKALRRHNSLDPELQPTARIFLRWAEPGPSGAGPPDPDVAPRETHFSPLPPDVQALVTDLVQDAPDRMRLLIGRWYRSQRDTVEIMKELGVCRKQLYIEVNAALWYFRGLFESCGLDVR